MAASGSVPLFEDPPAAGAGSSRSGGDLSTTVEPAGPTGTETDPWLQIEVGGDAVVLDQESIEFWLLVVQSVMVTYVAYKEVAAA